MRVVAVTVAMIAILVMALTLRPTPSATAAMPAQASAQIDPYALQTTIDIRSLPEQNTAVRISAGLDIFLDCMSLHPSEAWKPQLEEEIKRRELFLLFWSSAASESQWVAWEWHTALRARGKDAIQVHPLEVGVKPPDELKDLHFGDPFMLAREAYRIESTPQP